MQSKKILIIGSNGYIGSSLFLFLNNNNFDVHGLDLCLFDKNLGFSIEKDYKTLSKDYLSNFTDIILLAGNSSVQSCYDNVLYSFKNNIENFLLLLNNLTDQHKLIYASSSSVYGNTKNIIATEEYSHFSPISAYDLTKQTIDYYAKISNIEYYGLRFGTVNGKFLSNIIRQDIMINSMVKNAKEHSNILCINPDINRPILDLQDLCNAVLSIIMHKKNDRGIYNLASFNTTVGSVANEVSQILKSNIDIQHNSSYNIYDFKICNNKFMNTFNFTFTGTVQSIVSSLIREYEKNVFTDRRKTLVYV